jgi:hypothetical protein
LEQFPRNAPAIAKIAARLANCLLEGIYCSRHLRYQAIAMKPIQPSTIVHWLGRISAVALTGLFLLFLFGESEGTIDLANQPLGVQLIFLGWACIFLGYAVGWFRPIAGGAVVLAALAGMNAAEWSANGTLLGPWFFLWAAPGILYLVAGWLKHRPVHSLRRPAATT